MRHVKTATAASFALLIGTIAIVDLRMLGHGMRQEDPAALASDLNRWKWAGLTTILATGFLMFSPSATAYPHNASFRFKMAALAVSLLFHFTLRRRALLNSGRAPTAAAKWTAAASLLLWTAVVAAGRMIAFV